MNWSAQVGKETCRCHKIILDINQGHFSTESDPPRDGDESLSVWAVSRWGLLSCCSMRDVLCRACHFLLSAKLADDDVAPTTQFRFAVREKKVLCSALIWGHLLLSVGTSMGRDVRRQQWPWCSNYRCLQHWRGPYCRQICAIRLVGD